MSLDEDPREAILKVAKKAEEDPYWISPAYEKTQPVTIFQHDDGINDNKKTLTEKEQQNSTISIAEKGDEEEENFSPSSSDDEISAK